MNRNALVGIVAAVAGTLIVLAGAFALLRPTGGAGMEDAAGEASTSSAAAMPPRPDCPGPGVGAVALDCLGGQHAQPASDVTVVNVWAWWCAPCRGELPIVEQFAAAHPEYDVVGVHADPVAANGAALLEDLGVDLPSYQDNDNSFAGTLGLPGVIPITVVFRGDEQVGMFPTVFHSVAELEAAVAGVV